MDGAGGREEHEQEQSPNDHHGTYMYASRLLQTVPLVRRPGPNLDFFRKIIHFLCGFVLDKMAFCVGVKRHQNEERPGELSFLCLCRLSIERLEEPLKNNDDAFHCHLAGRRNSKNTWHGYD